MASLSNYLKQQYASALESELAGLKNAYDQNTATLVAIPYKNGVAQTASNYTYAWTKIAKNGTRTALTGTSSTMSVTDLDATYEVKLN